MQDYPIHIFYSAEDDGYIADIPDLVACSAFGKTPAEALKELEVAKEAWLEGKPIPTPKSTPSTARLFGRDISFTSWLGRR
ncbi:type II toxin-antitoxin system HicB family antitoxin [candidate division KSB1 bacterium]|nr:type II toxin-antitoxin system HicB family antitoxin [candidate division KSB1 bacterium]